MKLVSTLLLSLSLLSSATLAETTLFGLTLGKSPLNEVKQRYTLKGEDTTSSTPDSWHYYKVSGDQFSEPNIKHAVLYFDGGQVLGRVTLRFPSSLKSFDHIDKFLSQKYPRVITPAFEPNQLQLRRTDFQDSYTQVKLTYGYYGTNVTYADLDYRKAIKHAIAKKKAANDSQSVAKKPIRKPPHDDEQ
ncbi:hypothetical protein MK852_19495 [Shewanella benthica]|nr:hypothetical protein [Shewanella benthica]